MQEALSLSDAQVGLVNSVYLFPAMIFALPAGLLADRIGRRSVFTVFLGLFGFASLGLLLGPSFEILLVLRALQGAAFGSILPLSITIVGDLLSGAEQVREQGRRIFIMTASESVVPIVGGLLVTIAWHAPFAVNVLSLPLAVAGWFYLDVGHQRLSREVRNPVDVTALSKLFTTRLAVSLQTLGMFRFFFRFAALTYGPISLSRRDVPVALIALSLSGVGVAGALAALTVGKVLGRLTATAVLKIDIWLTVLAFMSLALVPNAFLAACALPVLGLAEGYSAVILNSMSVEGVSRELRATFIASMGAIRNFGKFLAPAAMGLALVWISLPGVLFGVGVLAVCALWFVAPLQELNPAFRTARP